MGTDSFCPLETGLEMYGWKRVSQESGCSHQRLAVDKGVVGQSVASKGPHSFWGPLDLGTSENR